LLVSMRLMGKRVTAQLSITELAVILMLGAAIGVPIQVSSQGVLPAVVVLITVVSFQRWSAASSCLLREKLRWLFVTVEYCWINCGRTRCHARCLPQNCGRQM
jgi:uncharacterized membrane protein YcaP (DUF421 family)